MKNKRLEAFHYVKKNRVSEDEESDVSISQNMHINTTSKDSESHVYKNRGGGGNSKTNCSSNGLQDTNMIGSKVQGDTSDLSDTSQSSAVHMSQRKSCTFLNDKHCRDEICSNMNSSFYVDDLSAEDEIYTFQCPEACISQNLFNQTFDFGKLNKIVYAKTNEVLQLNVVPIEKKSLTIAMPRKGKSGVLIKLPLKGHILIKRDVKTPFYNHEVTSEESYTCETDSNLLKELKSRHPLLGINWKVHIDLADEVFKRQNKKLKRKMKKKLKVKKTENVKRENELEAECLHLKKKRKMDLK